MAWIDAAVALLFVVGIAFLVHGSRRMAEDAVLRYGHNVDSGSYLLVGAALFFAPSVVAFGAAAVWLGRGWDGRWIMHWLAVAWLLAWTVLPFAASVIRSVFT